MNTMKKTLGALTLLFLLSNTLFADIVKPVKWKNELKQIDDKTYELRFEATIDAGWHLYGLNIPEDGPIATSFNYNDLTTVELIGTLKSSVKPEVKYDNTFEMDLELFDGGVIFTQKVKAKSDNALISGFIEFMACDDSRCLPPSEIDFSFNLGSGNLTETSPALPEREEVPVFGTKQIEIKNPTTEIEGALIDSPEISTISNAEEKSDNNKGLFTTLLIAILAGFGALLTPCVYPMIPLTVSFFMRGEKSKGKSITEALVFGISIVLIYTSLGVLVAIFKNPNAINSVSTHWIPNLLFFIIFIALAVSFFGVFEIVLPSGFANKVDQKADKGGFVGAFFMALGMAVLSFSCTGPIVASLLIKASQGQVLEPVIGMAGFSAAFALPFTLLAIFPGVLSKMPKSGGWMNAVKVFFAFILLAFALMFLSNIGLKFVTRDLVLALDIVIFTLLGFYLLGKIKFSHDSDLPHISVPRLILAIVSFAIAVYLVPGLFGSPLKAISPFLPPQETSEFSILSSTTPTHSLTLAVSDPKLCDESPKYSGFLHLPHGLKGYFDYEEALACGEEQNKPVFIDFVGHSCKNCKKMYSDVWSDPEILQLLRDEFIIVALYTDDRTKLPEDEWVTSSIDGKIKKTMGKRNVDFEITKFNSNALPLYAIVDANGAIITEDEFFTYNPKVDDFKAFLMNGIANFN